MTTFNSEHNREPLPLVSNDTEAPDQREVGQEISRREAVQMLAALPAALFWSTAELEKARKYVDRALAATAQGKSYAPKFFTPTEWRTVRVLADMVIPPDERSGGAVDAGVPEFMDFTMIDRPRWQKGAREGLAWIDAESNRRFGKPFADATQTQREQILNDIAWPARAPASMKAGVEFFNGFRDLTASGYWSSEIGVKDLRYMGNVFNPNWNGCPPAALQKLGVSYAKFDRSKLRLTPNE
jgi:hypothetical protein